MWHYHPFSQRNRTTERVVGVGVGVGGNRKEDGGGGLDKTEKGWG